MIATLIAIALTIAFFGWYLLAFNSLIAGRNRVDFAWSNVEVELTRRLDLIGNLVETVKGYATHEKATLENVIAARNAAAHIKGPEDASASQGGIAKAVASLFAVVEAYPQLKADENFRRLHAELVVTEDRIAERRGGYNAAVNEYRNQCEAFPSNIVAGLHDFPAKSFFDVPDDDVRTAPRVALT